jgi:hypothetical protein
MRLATKELTCGTANGEMECCSTHIDSVVVYRWLSFILADLSEEWVDESRIACCKDMSS